MDLPMFREKAQAGVVARKFASTIWKVLYGNKPGYMTLELDGYWYEQIDRYGWRRLSKAREHELKERIKQS